MSHLKGKSHSEAVRKLNEGREPSRDELQKFNISQIKDYQQQQQSGGDEESRIVKERQKALKRRSRKIKQRMIARNVVPSTTLIVQSNTIAANDSTNKTNFRRNLKELDKLCQDHARSIWSAAPVASLKRCLGQIERALSKTVSIHNDFFFSKFRITY